MRNMPDVPSDSLPISRSGRPSEIVFYDGVKNTKLDGSTLRSSSTFFIHLTNISRFFVIRIIVIHVVLYMIRAAVIPESLSVF